MSNLPDATNFPPSRSLKPVQGSTRLRKIPASASPHFIYKLHRWSHLPHSSHLLRFLLSTPESRPARELRIGTHSKEMQDNADLLQDFEDAEDALSLCDLPLHYKDDEFINWEDASAADTLTSSEHEHFEFCNDPKVETCPSENIIFCGKLFPSKQPLSHHTHIPKTFQFHPRLQSEQLNFYKLQSSSFGTARGRIISNDRSVVRDKFQGTASSRASPMAPPSSYQPPMKPRWYMGLFGLTRFPQKMEVEDLRIRQDRLSRPALSGGETVSVKSGGGSSGKGSWGLLRAFSCGPSEAAATASIRCMPHVVKCGSLAARAIPK